MTARNPLEDHELDSFLAAADASDGRPEMLGYLLPYSGLRASAAAHMTIDWLNFQREEIKVPTHRQCSCSECLRRHEKLRTQYDRVDGDLSSLEEMNMEKIRSEHDAAYLYDINDRLGRRTVREIIEDWDTGFWAPKTGQGARTIPLRNVKMLNKVRNWFKVHDAIGVTRQTLHSDVVELAEEAGMMRKVYPHHLRHTFGTKLASNGANASFIQKVMGHEDIQTSQGYIELSDERLHQQADEVMF